MKRRSLLSSLSTAALLSTVQWARCEVFLSADQAGDVLYPGQKLMRAIITLTHDQRKAIATASGVRLRSDTLQTARTAGGDWLIFDNVIGKHEFIDIAVAITKSGQVRGVEVMTYRETYGDQVRQPKWRAQFTGKSSAQPVEIDQDIKNISGATLSCVHVTEGVRRLLHTYEIVLKHL